VTSVLVCAAQAPFVTGGAERLVGALVDALRERGHRVDTVSVPFHGHPPAEIVRQALAWRMLELRETDGRGVDLVVPTKFPSYLVRHPWKVAWLVHQHRAAYDLAGTPDGLDPGDEEEKGVLDAVRAMDATGLGECRRIFTISRNVTERLARYNGLRSEPLHPPPPLAAHHRTDGYGDFLLYAGRLEPLKRVDLVLQALAAGPREARLRIAGRGAQEPFLRALAEHLGVAPRVEFLGYVEDADLVALYAACRAAVYVPRDEDYGYVPVESLLSRKPVLTALDSGGPLEFVEDGVTGFVAAPEPQALGAGIARLYAADERRLRAMGEDGRERVASISWSRVVEALLEGAP